MKESTFRACVVTLLAVACVLLAMILVAIPHPPTIAEIQADKSVDGQANLLKRRPAVVVSGDVRVTNLDDIPRR